MKIIKHFGKSLSKKGDFNVIECISCGFKHIDPLPSENELVQLYKQDFYSKDKPDYFKTAKKDYSWWMATYNNYYSLLEKHTRGRKILDIGSGPGDFLICGKKRGWKTSGIEPSHKAWKYSRRKKLSVINDIFRYESIKSYGLFDVIHASLVLEHILDPISFIKDIKKLLKPNGIIALYCPNDYNPLQLLIEKQLKFNPWWIVPKHHLNYFDADSIRKVLSKIGFDVVESLGTFPMEFFLLSGLNYVGDVKIGRKCQTLRKTFEMNMYKNNSEMLNSLYSKLIEENIGRSFFIIAKKRKL